MGDTNRPGSENRHPASGNRSEQPAPDMKRGLMNLLMLGLLVLLAVRMMGGSEPTEHSYSEFLRLVQQGAIAEVILEGRQVTAILAAPGAETGELEPRAGSAPEDRFQTYVPEFGGEELLGLLEQHQVEVRVKPAQGPWWQTLLIALLPWVLLIGFFLFMASRLRQQMSGPGSNLFSFGESKAKRFREDLPQTTFDDVAGAENAKQDLREVIDFLCNPEDYQRLGAKLPRGMLLVGPPGTGKTLLARAAAGEARVPFFSIAGSEFIEMFVGVGAARVRDLFKKAREEAPSIIFIDELDAIGRARGAGVGGGHDEREQTLNQILSEMDGFAPHETVIVLAATNRPDVLDSALLRPGRFDRKVVVGLPHRDARLAILKVHTRRVPLAKDVSLEAISRRCIGFSGADLENLVNEAALFAGRDNCTEVAMHHFELARDKVLLGAERENRMSEDEQRLVAWHESGHALAALLFEKADPLEKVTIVPRGQALGVTHQTPLEERSNISFSYARDRLAVMLAGRVAEKLAFSEVSSGAESDLEQATKLARRMVARWGMSDALGPVAYQVHKEDVFLGREIVQERDFSEATAQLIDEQVRKLVGSVERLVERQLQANRQQLAALAQALLERETLDRAEVERILAKLPDSPKTLAKSESLADI